MLLEGVHYERPSLLNCVDEPLNRSGGCTGHNDLPRCSGAREQRDETNRSRHLAHWDTKTDRWVVEKDRIEIAAGGSFNM